MAWELHPAAAKVFEKAFQNPAAWNDLALARFEGEISQPINGPAPLLLEKGELAIGKEVLFAGFGRILGSSKQFSFTAMKVSWLEPGGYFIGLSRADL